MKQTIDWARFQHGFERCGRASGWSEHGLEKLFDHLTMLDQAAIESGGDESEFDPVALDCTYSELTLVEFLCELDPDNAAFDWLCEGKSKTEAKRTEESLSDEQTNELKAQIKKHCDDCGIVLVGFTEVSWTRNPSGKAVNRPMTVVFNHDTV